MTPIIVPIAANGSVVRRHAGGSCDHEPTARSPGVCAGVAEYFDLDVTLVRLVWLITAVMTGIGLLSYPIAWIVMPEERKTEEVPAGHTATH